MSKKAITKTARIHRKPGESVRVQIDEVTVVYLRVKGKDWFSIEYPEGVQVSREEGKAVEIYDAGMDHNKQGEEG